MRRLRGEVADLLGFLVGLDDREDARDIVIVVSDEAMR